MPYELIANKMYTFNGDEFFGDKVGCSRDALIFARLRFSFYACHIGYFDKPQFGKWEIPVVRACGITIEEMLDKGVSLVERTQDEIQADIFQQLETFGNLLRFSYHKYSMLNKENLETLGVLNSLREDYSKLERKLNKMQSDLDKRSHKIDQLQSKLKGQKKPEQVIVVPKDVRSLEKELENTRYERDRYATTVDNLETYIMEQRKTYESQKRKQIREDDPGQKDMILYSVEFHPKIRSYENDPRNHQMVEKIKRKLSRGVGKTLLLSSRSKTGARERLMEEYPEYNMYFKLNLNGDRVAFAFENEDQIYVLKVSSHDDYKKDWGGPRRK